MREWIKRLAGLVVFLAPFWGCSLATDGSALSEGCPEGTKACEGMCVSTAEKDFGCGSSGCSPCGLFRAAAKCNSAQECVIASCVGAWEDCDRLPDNGCEVNTDQDKANCGKCNEVCADPDGGESSCGNANCYIRWCDAPRADCNQRYEDGCEVDLNNDEDHCGACDTPCEGKCVDGQCADD